MTAKKRLPAPPSFGPLARATTVLRWIAHYGKYFLAPLSVFSTIGVALFPFWISAAWPDESDKHPTYPVGLMIWFTVAIVAGLVSAGLLEASRRGKIKEQVVLQAKAQQTLREAVLPSLRATVKLIASEPSKRAELFAKLCSDVLKAAPVIFGTDDGIRMVIYRIERFNGERILEPIDSVGRVIDQPLPFVETQRGRGEKVFQWLSDRHPRTRFIANTDKEKDPAWAGSGRGYKTYISAAITAGAYPLGMLTVDAPRAGDLDDTHKPMMEVLAQILSTAFVIGPE